MAKKRVLIMDDNDSLRAGIREILERAGYAVAEAADGREGLAKAESLRPDVLLLDVLMPDLDGCEVCQRLKTNPPTEHIAVIFLTGIGDEAVHKLALKAGAAAYITKPFQLETLVATIEAALANVERQAKPKAKNEEDRP